ncbi:HAMP domain-containing histidine kinase [Streptosporangiaceae bacterium NEAU-GS5]|nr:HAMP domain-containing histidine kinase [Streptosporangiaceae bacterium NEAU-GS5]
MAVALVGVGVGVMALRRSLSIGVMVAVVALVTLSSTLAGVVAAMLAMINDDKVVFVVLSIGGFAGLGVAVVVGRRIVTASRGLVAAVEAVPPTGEFTPPERRLPRELETISDALEQAHERLRRARERERALESARRDLVAWVSHDLRTPLAGMRAMAEALEDGVADDPDTVKRYHTQIRLEVDRLSGMVDDLFELSRIHAGALRLSPHRVGLADVVADALAVVEPLARSKGVSLRVDAAEVIPMEADAGALVRALRNLVVNGVRHTPPDGEVVIEARSEGRLAVLGVKDACGGIPLDDLPRVFDVAFRGEAARTPGPDGGAGLGLAIARGIVEAHQGAIEVVNEPPGCRFEIRLPLAP